MRGGEIDIVAKRGRTLVICEVKARATNNFGTALEAMTDTKQRRVRRAGFAYLAAHGISGVEVRFDVAAVTGTTLEMHCDAF